ncbi:Serine/threonine protein kinase [Singulisphaera sp. GP187]|uniref:serine/threonine-protein kinase n=1 Tax=Singulisphaera sp. GP187 TaxID=1882752 RepID=UPI00092793AE|nr:serine/threonine-protein kinase [Singulisphaera sp. GP187]SIO29255.1 Serine/threonine protein kinase [Singulisphaera sp. GP187]
MDEPILGRSSDPATRLRFLWDEGRQPDVRAFLDRGGALSPTELAGVLRVDQDERWRVGDRIPASTYLRAFPALRNDPEAAFELVYSEFLLRDEQGEALEPEAFCQAYPEFVERFRIQAEVREALGKLALDSVDTFVSHNDCELSSGGLGRPTPSAGVGWPAVAGYEIRGELGRGGMGVVYKAVEVRLRRVVALKMIIAGPHAGPVQLARFRVEAESAARLQHPNIVQIYAVGEQEGRPFVALEYVDGGTLQQTLDGRPHPPDDSARLVATLAGALHAAHRRDIIHRDIKPANILLTSDGIPKVADFGLAKLLDDANGADASTALTHTGALLGTPSSMAPEQADGRLRDIGPATDVHALGVILYELLTGRSPFQGSAPLEILEQVRSLAPVPPRRLRPTLPHELEVICLKCLEKEPGRRYAGADALAEDLRRYLGGEPILARDSNVIERLTGALRRGPHAKEFQLWTNVMFAVIPLGMIPHLIVFVTAVTAPGYLRAAFIIPWFVFVTLCGGLFWLNRTRLRSPTTPAVRQVAAMLVGHGVASCALPLTCRLLGLTARPEDELRLYPFLALLVGQFYFSMGGSYWGGFYLAGLGFVLLAPLMAIGLRFAPLEFAILFAVSQLAIGFHLQRLGRTRPEAGAMTGRAD